jgi:hypothetical protein
MVVHGLAIPLFEAWWSSASGSDRVPGMAVEKAWLPESDFWLMLF